MFIGLKDIQDLFPYHHTESVENGALNCIMGYQPLRTAPTPYLEHLLYVLWNDEELNEFIPTKNMNYMLITSADFKDIQRNHPDVSKDSNILFIESDDPPSVLYKLQTYFDMQCGVSLFAETVLDHLFYENGIQSMIDRVHRTIQNPIYVFDASFKLIATNWDEAGKTEQGKRIIENGGLTESDFKVINRDQHLIHQKMMSQETPIRTFNEVLGYEQLLCAISTQRDLGHIVIDGTLRTFSDTDEKFLMLLKEGIDQQLKKDEFIRNNRGFNYEYYLKDLLDGKIATNQQYLDRMNYTNSTFSDNLYCIVVEPARSANLLNTKRICSLFEKAFPLAKTLIYNGQIIIIISPPDANRLAFKQYEKIRKLCEKEGLFAGISNNFDSITNIREYYRQALRAIEIGTGHHNKPTLFRYDDYYLQHMSNLFLQKESQETFCHPELKKLLHYDMETNGMLAETLYNYLVNERNLANTAKVMGSHRNTLVYRLKRINELTSINFEDHKERQYIMLSYEIMTGQDH